MNQSYNQMFVETESLEENKYQKILLGHKKDHPETKVIIHKFIKSERFDDAFCALLESLQNVLDILEEDGQYILISKYLEGDNISLHLNFSNITDIERLDYLYEYLHQCVAYIGFDHYIFNLLISSSQIVFIDHKLHLKEQIVLDRRIDEDMPFSMVSKNIGQVMQRLLITNYNELRTSRKYDELYQFTETLIRREKDYQCFDDLFNDFKKIYFTKDTKKKRVLLGDNHPNNMYLEQTQDKPFATTIKEAPAPPVKEPAYVAPNLEVTEEERAILTGPVEEHIDLSKLNDKTSTLEELIIKDEAEAYEAPKENEIDEPEYGYGVPDYMKEEPEPETKKEKVFNTNWIIPAVIGVMVIILTIIGIRVVKFFNTDNTLYQRPEAKFEAFIEDGALVCKNLSVAYDGQSITESLWVITKDGKEVLNESMEAMSGIRVSNMSEGVYTIKLTVTDSATQFSDPYVIEKEYLSPESKSLENQNLSEARISKDNKANDHTQDIVEKLDNYVIESTENVSVDTSIYYSGDKSLKMDLSEGDAKLILTGLDVEAKSTISFWMMTKDPLTITAIINGFNNGLNNYNKQLATTNSEVLSWKAISVQLNVDEETDYLTVEFPQSDTIVWFDDFTIRTFK
ncbi:MAG: hypothetical protein JXR88_17100 [Clostridia bacterium]|nr:hypothetical protein [Clostridia bacterium]